MYYYYTAYNLHIQSELHLPELVPAAPTTKPDVLIVVERVGAAAQPTGDIVETFSMETPVATYFFSAGRKIIIKPLADAAEDALRLYLLGPVIAALLRLRKLLVLHAGGVVVNGGAIIFLGDAGWGKSTIVEAFYRRGHQLIADDVIAIEPEIGESVVLPGIPQAKLWPDAIDFLGYKSENLSQLFKGAFKRAHRPVDRFLKKKCLLRHIYILGPKNDQHQIQRLNPHQAFLEVVRFSRNMDIPGRIDLNRSHFNQCDRLVQQVSVSLLKRKKSLDALPELVEMIETDIILFEKHPSQIKQLPDDKLQP